MGKKKKTIQEYEKINRSKLKNTLDEIYRARSRFVHEGIKLPSSIVLGHFRNLPADAINEAVAKASESESVAAILQIPPLITLERLVSLTLVEFLNRQEHIP